MSVPEGIIEIHGSEVSAFHGCRLRHQWQYVDLWSPPVVPAPLEFGSAFHVGMETFWSPDTWHLANLDLYVLAKGAFTAECDRQRREFLDRVEQYELDPEIAQEYQERVDLGLGMLRKFIRTIPRERYRPLMVESEFLVQVELAGKRMSVDGKPVYYGLRADAILEDKIDGGYYLVDWKTTSQLIKDQTILDLDSQVTSYCWAVMKVLNLDIRGFLYVQIFKGYPKPPKQLAVFRQGRSYSTNKAQRTDFETFKRFIAKHDSDAYHVGLYDEYLEWLKEDGPEFVKWFRIYKNTSQLDIAGKDLGLRIKDMINDHDVYPVPNHIQCRMCPFQLPCLERQSGGDYEEVLNTQYVKTEPYYVTARKIRNEA